MSKILGSQWQNHQATEFQDTPHRRRYLCHHDRRQDACRECGGHHLAVRWMWYAAKSRAKRDGVPCTLSFSDVLSLYGDGICPVLGISYKFSARRRKGGLDASPSIDRFIPALGYTKENCFVISNLANRIKNNATVAQVESVALWMRQVENQKKVQDA